jgi:hypothetical protein
MRASDLLGVVADLVIDGAADPVRAAPAAGS